MNNIQNCDSQIIYLILSKNYLILNTERNTLSGNQDFVADT
jgi:hypothetical protein